MASSETEIANMALSHLAMGQEIANLETENSAAASACRRFYDIARDELLRGFSWPFATKIVTLGLLTDSEDDDHPTDEWAYQYQLPSNCLEFRKIQSGTRLDNSQSRIPYRLAYGDSGTVIFTDQEDAVGEFTVRVESPTRYPPDFTMALSLLLAAYVAPRLTKGDPFKLGARVTEMYKFAYSVAAANALKEEQSDQLPDAESIRSRE